MSAWKYGSVVGGATGLESCTDMTIGLLSVDWEEIEIMGFAGLVW